MPLTIIKYEFNIFLAKINKLVFLMYLLFIFAFLFLFNFFIGNLFIFNLLVNKRYQIY